MDAFKFNKAKDKGVERWIDTVHESSKADRSHDERYGALFSLGETLSGGSPEFRNEREKITNGMIKNVEGWEEKIGETLGNLKAEFGGNELNDPDGHWEESNRLFLEMGGKESDIKASDPPPKGPKFEPLVQNIHDDAESAAIARTKKREDENLAEEAAASERRKKKDEAQKTYDAEQAEVGAAQLTIAMKAGEGAAVGLPGAAGVSALVNFPSPLLNNGKKRGGHELE